MRKYEIHLPLADSNGKPIDQKKIGRVREELLTAFGSFVFSNQRLWRYDSVRYVEILKIEIVTTNDQVPKKFLQRFKERLKESSRQTDILITTHRIQTA